MGMNMDIASIEPFEICSIRPPTENNSLTFRLTRNCYWNKCRFCPVYKLGAKFSKRKIEEVKTDINNAKNIHDLLFDNKMINTLGEDSSYNRAKQLIKKIKHAKRQPRPDRAHSIDPNLQKLADEDERIKWFLQWFKDKPSLEDSFYHIISWHESRSTNCFLGDADSLILKPEFLFETLDYIKSKFPDLKRFTIYGRTKTAAVQRSIKDLTEYHNAGLNRVHFGLESGSDRVLEFVNKGENAAHHIEGGTKIKEAGLSCSVYVMPGLGGVEMSEEHTAGTIDVINKIEPEFTRLRTLEIFPQSPLEEEIRAGNFTEASEELVVKEIRRMIESINIKTEIVSDSAINLLGVYGILPDDRGRMLAEIDEYLDLDDLEKINFSLNSRIESFIGQYGGLTEDIYKSIMPFVKNERLSVTSEQRKEALNVIKMIRGKLMP